MLYPIEMRNLILCLFLLQTPAMAYKYYDPIDPLLEKYPFINPMFKSSIKEDTDVGIDCYMGGYQVGKCYQGPMKRKDVVTKMLFKVLLKTTIVRDGSYFFEDRHVRVDGEGKNKVLRTKIHFGYGKGKKKDRAEKAGLKGIYLVDYMFGREYVERNKCMDKLILDDDDGLMKDSVVLSCFEKEMKEIERRIPGFDIKQQKHGGYAIFREDRLYESDPKVNDYWYNGEEAKIFKWLPMEEVPCPAGLEKVSAK